MSCRCPVCRSALDYRVLFMYEPCRHSQVSSFGRARRAFDAVDEVNIHEPCQDGEVSEEENAELTESERLPTHVQDMSVKEMAEALAEL